MKRTVRIFWSIFFIGFAAFIALVMMANFGVFGKMPSSPTWKILPFCKALKFMHKMAH
jgi:hypothetical protein